MQLSWKASFSATCLHAAASMLEGLPIAEQSNVASLLPAAEQLSKELQAAQLPTEQSFPRLISLAAEYENNRQLIEVVAAQLLGINVLSQESLSRLAATVAELESIMLQQQPDLVEQLAVRSRPLREQWDARGPGLMRQAARLADDTILPAAAEIVLVTPVVGGHGRAHLRNNRITFEAVLTNPNPTLPETLRLGWLLAQLNLDLPCYSEAIATARLAWIASLATVPLILSAAETVELAEYTPATLVEALSCWHLPTDKAIQLQQWWDTYNTSNTTWSVALAALEAMLSN